MPIPNWPHNVIFECTQPEVRLLMLCWSAVLALDPLIGAIVVGCAVFLKVSEVAPTTSALIARLLSKYVDTNAIQVVEGEVSEITALLE